MLPAHQSACTFVSLEPSIVCRSGVSDLTPDIFMSFTPALPDGIGTNSGIPLQICLKKNYFELVHLLLTKGADPRNVSIAQGDTPLHAAVSICLNNRGKAFVCLGPGDAKGSGRCAPAVFTTAVENIPVFLPVQPTAPPAAVYRCDSSRPGCSTVSQPPRSAGQRIPTQPLLS